MGRLIGEDELIKGRVENDPVVIAAKCTPTAYDLDKVVEQLEDISKVYCEEYHQQEGILWLQDAVEIVKRGGADE